LESSPIKKTINEEKEWFKNHFGEHIEVLKKINDQIIILKTDGQITSETSVELKIGDKLTGIPYRHSRKIYKLKEIKRDGVIMEYESHFDHSSFGRHLKTVDTGEIFIKYIE